MAAYQKGDCHMSYTTTQRFWNDVMGIPMSRSQLVIDRRNVPSVVARGMQVNAQDSQMNDVIPFGVKVNERRRARTWTGLTSFGDQARANRACQACASHLRLIYA